VTICFRVILSYCSKLANFNLPQLQLAPAFGVTHLSFAEIFGIRKLESWDIVWCCLRDHPTFSQYHRTPTYDRPRQTHSYGIYRASMTLCSKIARKICYKLQQIIAFQHRAGTDIQNIIVSNIAVSTTCTMSHLY